MEIGCLSSHYTKGIPTRPRLLGGAPQISLDECSYRSLENLLVIPVPKSDSSTKIKNIGLNSLIRVQGFPSAVEHYRSTRRVSPSQGPCPTPFRDSNGPTRHIGRSERNDFLRDSSTQNQEPLGGTCEQSRVTKGRSRETRDSYVPECGRTQSPSQCSKSQNPSPRPGIREKVGRGCPIGIPILIWGTCIGYCYERCVVPAEHSTNRDSVGISISSTQGVQVVPVPCPP